jgi:hypothetical protein
LHQLADALLAEGCARIINSILFGKSISTQLDAYYELCDLWAADIFSSRFWDLFLSGQATAHQLRLWAFQFFHRTVGADVHNAIAFESCIDDEIKSGLRDHYFEEFGHGEMFRNGLVNCGFSTESVTASKALQSTIGLIDYMSDLGRSDSWAYLGCYGVLHSPRKGQTKKAVEAQFGFFKSLYPDFSPFFEEVCKHAILDLDLGHDAIFLEEVARKRGYLRPKEAQSVVLGAHGMINVFVEFYEGIMRRVSGTY